MIKNVPKISFRQVFFAFMCKKLAGDSGEERTTNLVPNSKRIRGIRLKMYKFFQKLRWNEADRLVKKYKTHCFTSRKFFTSNY